MPTHKDLKRLTRSRMQKTGESYTTARSRLLAKNDPAPTQPAAVPDFATLGGMSDEAVLAKTGRTWAQWVSRLDAAGAVELPHSEIAAYVRDHFEISDWWAQTVTVGYERIRGLRAVGQRRDGTYEANKSKTFPVSVGELYEACNTSELRQRWLPGVELTVRKATPEKSLRITWGDGTSVELYFTAKSETKSQVAIQHRKLTSQAESTQMKAYWGERLTALKELLVATES